MWGKTFDITEAEEEEANARFALRLLGERMMPCSGYRLKGLTPHQDPLHAQKRESNTSLRHQCHLMLASYNHTWIGSADEVRYKQTASSAPRCSFSLRSCKENGAAKISSHSELV